MSEGDQITKTRSRHIIGSLLLSSLLIAALQQSVSIGFPMMFPSILATPFLGLQAGNYRFLLFSLPTFLSFLINPIMLFVVIYFLGRNINVARYYVSVGISLFAGGLIGNSIPYFLLPELLGSHWEVAFPDLLSVVTTVIDFAIILLGFGFSTLFSGFFAVSLANLRRHRNTPSPTKMEQPNKV